MSRRKRKKNPCGTKKNQAPEKSPLEALKNPLGIPWWVWLGVGAGALYLYIRSRAAATVSASPAAILPKDTAAASLQSKLNAAITDALGYQQGDVLNISFPSVTSGPVTVSDNKSGKTVLSTIQAPATLLNFVLGGGLNQYYNQDITDPYSSQGWQKATIVV